MPDSNKELINKRLDALKLSTFRAKFNLAGIEREMVIKKGRGTIRRHAGELVKKRLAPALPYKDGKQTPFKGHPVFVAQHATAVCCRTCLLKWHKVPKGRELTNTEQAYVVSVIDTWIDRELK